MIKIIFTIYSGLQAKELHLCGEAGAIPLIQEICDTTGEELEVNKFDKTCLRLC